MRREFRFRLGTLLSLLTILGPAACIAQDDTRIGAVVPPASCEARPAGLEAGTYPWDAPACAGARAKWEASHSKPAVVPAFSAEVGAVTAVPAGTAVPVHVVGTVSSGSAKSDDVFQIQVATDVIVNDLVVFQKGAGGQGHVVDADAAGGNGHSGTIALVLDYVYATDGGRVRLADAQQKQVEEDRKGASSTATIVGFATFGIGGLFGHNLAHGRQKTIDEKTTLSAFVASTVHVATNQHAISAHYDR